MSDRVSVESDKVKAFTEHSKLMMAAFMIAVAITGGSACAMTNETSPALKCTVGGADKAVAAVGGADAVCGMMRSAIASSGVEAAIHVEIVSAHAAVAQVTTGGRTLDQRRIDISDRTLNGKSIETLAKAVADQLTSLGGSAD